LDRLGEGNVGAEIRQHDRRAVILRQRLGSLPRRGSVDRQLLAEFRRLDIPVEISVQPVAVRPRRVAARGIRENLRSALPDLPGKIAETVSDGASQERLSPSQAFMMCEIDEAGLVIVPDVGLHQSGLDQRIQIGKTVLSCGHDREFRIEAKGQEILLPAGCDRVGRRDVPLLLGSLVEERPRFPGLAQPGRAQELREAGGAAGFRLRILVPLAVRQLGGFRTDQGSDGRGIDPGARLRQDKIFAVDLVDPELERRPLVLRLLLLARGWLGCSASGVGDDPTTDRAAVGESDIDLPPRRQLQAHPANLSNHSSRDTVRLVENLELLRLVLAQGI
jgi:hypothetical protein